MSIFGVWGEKKGLKSSANAVSKTEFEVFVLIYIYFFEQMAACHSIDYLK